MKTLHFNVCNQYGATSNYENIMKTLHFHQVQCSLYLMSRLDYKGSAHRPLIDSNDSPGNTKKEPILFFKENCKLKSNARFYLFSFILNDLKTFPRYTRMKHHLISLRVSSSTIISRYARDDFKIIK